VSDGNQFHSECNQFHSESDEFHSECNQFPSKSDEFPWECNRFDAECNEFHSPRNSFAFEWNSSTSTATDWMFGAMTVRWPAARRSAIGGKHGLRPIGFGDLDGAPILTARTS
jgi:hypothetical protein